MNSPEFLIFLHKYDIKHDLLATQILKLDKENPVKEMNQKHYTILVHL